MAPVVAVMVPLYAIFRSAGLVGTLPGLILAYTTFNLPFAIWILKGFFDNVPYAIEEAQMCDGCHPPAGVPLDPAAGGARHRRVPGPVRAVRLERLPVRLDHRLGRREDPAGGDASELVQPQNIQWGSIMAAGVVTTLPMMFLGLLIRRYLVAGLTMGAVRE